MNKEHSEVEVTNSNKIPFVIYHYTDLKTLDAILTNNTIRLSDITKSNDSLEITWIQNYISKCFIAAYNAVKTNYLESKINLTLWEKAIDELSSSWFDLTKSRYSYYVCCFSTRKDLLSQRRGYANDGIGVSIGFNTDALQTLIHTNSDELKNRIALKRVNYDRRSQQKSVRAVADQLIRGLKYQIKSNPEIDKDSVRKLLYNKGEESFENLFKLAIVMKNPFFREEKEVRLCYLVENESIPDSKPLHPEFYVEDGILYQDNTDAAFELNEYAHMQPFHYFIKGNGISSYVDLSFSDYIDKQKECQDPMPKLISSVWLGPKCNITKKEMERMLRMRKFPNVKVDTSNGSYR